MEEEKMKHVCKFCKKRFACGRSLGGHIRCHLPKPGYKLRENPKKTWRVIPNHATITSSEIETGSSGLMKVNHEDHGEGKRSSHVGNNSQSCVSEVVEEDQQDENDVAMCLIMLSKDMGPWGGGKNSSKNKRKRRGKVFTAVTSGEVRITDGEKITQKGLKMKGVFEVSDKPSFSLYDKVEDFTASGNVRNGVKVEEFGKYESVNAMDSEGFLKITTPDKNYCKRSKFECTTCNKLFHSYQALGGHKASHKRLLLSNSISNSNSNDQEQTPQEKDQISIDVSQGSKSIFSKKAVQKHECPVCFRVFSSGQALGGHKRSHLLDQNVTIDNDVIERSSSSSETRDNMLDLDLNLAPVHVHVKEEANNIVITTASSSNSLVGMIKPYWWVENPNKNDPFLSLMPN